MQIFKPKFWSKKNSLISYSLLPFSLFFQLFLILKKNLSKEEKFSIPIICVGNIYVGGTGKTPLAIEIVKILKKINIKSAIVKKSYEQHNDEFRLIKSKKITLFKSSSRAAAIKEAEINKFDCVVLDDGYQDFSINKNLNILCFNEKQLIGNGMVLPSGPLRGPLSSLKKSQIIVINGNKNSEFEKKIKHISNKISIYYSKYSLVNIKKFMNKNILAFAGIGNPENFFSLLEENNLKIIKKIPYPDHYNYSIKELNKLISFALKNNLKIVTTEKDYFRIKHFKLFQIDSLNVKLKILDKVSFEKKITKYL